ncbi:MAG: acyltransferase family protein [Bacteroidales bacterium]|nr:acyltransferase family protein [Bacteroidales bacterium]
MEIQSSCGTKQRIATIDILKGVGIILVVLGHVDNTALGEWIYTFHMPLFFVVSGLLFRPGKDVYLKKAKTILIPYFIFAVISYLYWRFFEIRFRPQDPSLDINAHFLDILWQREEFKFNVALWFLPCLFIATSLLNLITTNIRNRVVVSLICVLWVLAATLYSPSTRSCWIMETWCAFPFVVLGWLLGRERLSEIDSALAAVPKYVRALAVVPLIAVVFIPHGGSMMVARYSMDSYAYYFFVALVCVASVYVLSTLLVSCKWLRWLGVNTLAIMCIHEPVKRIVIKMFSVVANIGTDELRGYVICSIAVTAAVLLILVPICKLIDKYVPWVWGRS